MKFEYEGPISVEDQDHADNTIVLHKTEGLPEWTTSFRETRSSWTRTSYWPLLP